MAIKNLHEVYKCNICGNIVEAVHTGVGSLVCCGQEMQLQLENTTDGAVEKHVPVVERSGNKIVVKVGENAHPMEESHYIEWIELVTDNLNYKKFLNPGDKPEVEFEISEDVENIIVREYCNLHGLWKK